MSGKTTGNDKPKGSGGKREGAGRKARAPEERLVKKTIGLPPEVWAGMDKLRGRQSRPAWIAEAVRRELEG